MFDDYKKDVLKSFLEKQHKNELPINLTRPTAAPAKKACVIAFRSRYQRKDERILCSFFELGDGQEIHEHFIQRFDPDRFRPLLAFMRGTIQDTADKNVELLAWLIDYGQRPYQPASYPPMGNEKGVVKEEMQSNERDMGVNDLKVTEERQETQNEGGENGAGGAVVSIKPESGSGLELRMSSLKSGFGVFLIVLMAAWAGLSLLDRSKENDGKCMYWTGDEHKQLACDKKMGDTPVYAYDSLKLATFKRITRPDTITRRAKGWVWYLKYNNRYEFFTSKGNHPVYLQKRLRPITDYIIDRIPLII